MTTTRAIRKEGGLRKCVELGGANERLLMGHRLVMRADGRRLDATGKCQHARTV